MRSWYMAECIHINITVSTQGARIDQPTISCFKFLNRDKVTSEENDSYNTAYVADILRQEWGRSCCGCRNSSSIDRSIDIHHAAIHLPKERQYPAYTKLITCAQNQVRLGRVCMGVSEFVNNNGQQFGSCTSLLWQSVFWHYASRPGNRYWTYECVIKPLILHCLIGALPTLVS